MAFALRHCHQHHDTRGASKALQRLAASTEADCGCSLGSCVAQANHGRQSVAPRQVLPSQLLLERTAPLAPQNALHQRRPLLVSWRCGMCLHAPTAACVTDDEAVVVLQQNRTGTHSAARSNNEPVAAIHSKLAATCVRPGCLEARAVIFLLSQCPVQRLRA